MEDSVEPLVEPATPAEPKKRKKLTRACDQCSHRKIRCLPDAANPSQCLCCTKAGLTCTAVKEHRRRGPAPLRIEELHARQNRIHAPPHSSTSTSVGGQSYTTTSLGSQSYASTSVGDASYPIPATGLTPTFSLPVRLPSDLSQATGLSTNHALEISPQNSLPRYMPAPEKPVAPLNSDWATNAQQTDLDLFFLDNFVNDWPTSALEHSSTLLPSTTFDTAFLHTLGGFDAPLAEQPDMTGYNSLFPSPQDADLYPAVTENSDYSPTRVAAPSVRPPNPVNDGIPPLEHGITTQAIALYFQCYHPMCPILNQETVTEAFARNEHETSPSFRLTVMCIAAIVETSERLQRRAANDTEAKSVAPGTYLTAATKLAVLPSSAGAMSVNRAAVSLLLFLAWDMLGEREAAWLRLQEAITLVQLLRLDSLQTYLNDLAIAEAAIRLYWMLVICERATTMLLHFPAYLRRPLRLPDDAWSETQTVVNHLPNNALHDFPTEHVRIFSLVTSQLLQCWQGICCSYGQRCTVLTVDAVSQLQRHLLDVEARLSDQGNGNNAAASKLQHANLVVTIAWFRDRLWTISLRHGLISEDGSQYFCYGFVQEILSQVVSFCERMSHSDLDSGLDWAEKVYDMAMTAIAISKLSASDDATTIPSIFRPDKAWKGRLMPYVYRILGLFTKFDRLQDSLLPSLIKGISQIG